MVYMSMILGYNDDIRHPIDAARVEEVICVQH